MNRLSTTALGELCQELVHRLGIAGAQVAVGLGTDLRVASVGTANVALGTPVTDDTLFQIGSTTKVYTAALVLQLVEEGQLSLDQPIATYLPDVRLGIGEAWRAITPRHLLGMTSGLDNGPYTDTGSGDDAVARYVELLAEIPLTFAPGASYGYSNASTNVSGLLIERLTGAAWDVALRERLLDPAGLQESATLHTSPSRFPVAVGHLPRPAGVPGVPPRWCFSRGCGPAGSSLAASARDLARFGQVLLRCGQAADGTRVLTQDAVATMQTPQVMVPARLFADRWCLGPYLKSWGGVDVYGHSGTTENGSSLLLWVPAADAVLATVVNTPSRGYPFADAVADVVFRDWLGIAKPQRLDPGGHVLRNGARYAGTYAAHGVTYQVRDRGEELELVVESTGPLAGGAQVRTALRPIAEHRFLPDDDTVTGNHTWDVAFTAYDDGRAQLLHNGAFAARRVA